jgi:hypothetical protein
MKNRHSGASITILGSGPSLQYYSGDAEVSIAVNGAAALNHPYTYFMCGDRRSPERPWFLLSQKHHATRIISSFVAPHDPLLYPEASIRASLQEDFRNHKRRYLLPWGRASYTYKPRKSPRPPHCYFNYGGSLNRRSFQMLKWILTRSAPRFRAGATISGVALQLAVFMGARQIRLYGVDQNNFDGRTYFDPSANVGLTGFVAMTSEVIKRFVFLAVRQGGSLAT